jgi:hypothetical protein
MTNNTIWEALKEDGETLLERVRQAVNEGNVRRVTIEHEGRTVAVFPLTAGVVGALLAPPLAAIAVIVGLLKDCTIHVERVREDEQSDTARKAS